MEIDPVLTEKDIEGLTGAVELRAGLTLHWADIRVRKSIKQKVEVPSGVSLTIVLSGRCHYAWCQSDDNDGALCTAQYGGALLARAASGKIVRELRRGETLRHIGLSLSPEWLEQSQIQNVWRSLPLWEETGNYWPLTESIRKQSETILSLLRQQMDWKNLQLESHCLALLADCLAQQSSLAPQACCPVLSQHQRTRLEAVRSFLASETAMRMSLSEIARHFATNPTSLQQQFRLMFGVTVFTVLRDAKMRHARQMLMRGISVAEISRQTGFANPSSFSVAFKKRYRLSPSQARTHDIIDKTQ